MSFAHELVTDHGDVEFLHHERMLVLSSTWAIEWPRPMILSRPKSTYLNREELS